MAKAVHGLAGLSDGIWDLPPGKIAAVATYLDMTGATRPPPEPPAHTLGFQSLAGRLGRYRSLYAAIGHDWLWFSRQAMSDRDVSAIIDDPAVSALAVTHDGREVGLLEISFRHSPDCELSFLGLLPATRGHGLGLPVVQEAIRRAFARPIRRLWLHTCSLDHPAALGLYVRAGFRPYRRAVEVADDPRLTGTLPREAAPAVPIL